MIELSFEHAVAAYILLFIGFFMGVGVFIIQRKTGSIYKKESKYWQCSICTFVYLSIFDQVITVCPRCGSYNKKEGES
ncbi:MAG: hypothetical protein HY810_03680 [Candidatus Omnitrophica bacterium]|nr:hypothetical protein [Candidatus Omnitrophota bacterium]